MPVLPLDEPLADYVAEIFDQLRIPDVPGQPTMGESGAGWFRDIIRAAFAATDTATGALLVREVFCLVPKKNGKTTYTAALGITALLLNEIPGAELLIISATQKAAETCFNQARGIILADVPPEGGGDPYLVERFQIKDHKSEIYDRKTGATLKVKSFDVKVVTGTIPLLAIVDELHLLGSMARAQKVLAQIRGGMITRENSLLVFITTQSDEPPAGVFASELTYARGVRDGEIKESNTLVCLYEFPEAMQIDEEKPWLDPANWAMVLPNLGASISLPRLQALYRQEASKGKAALILWASQHLNIQIGLALHNNRWIGVDYWMAATQSDLDLDEILATSDCIVGGVDGGGLDDLMGVALIGRCKETRRWRGWARAWAQEIALERRKEIAPLLEGFEADGDLVICSDPTEDLHGAADLFERVSDAGLLPAQYGIGLDPYGITALTDELRARGLEETLVSVGQGARLSPAIWGLERKLQDGTFKHCGQPLLNWCVSNARSEQRGNAVLINKAISGKGKIDPLIAILNAFELMSRNPEVTKAVVSPWENPDFRLAAE